MSFLCYLLQDEISDLQLLHDVEQLEAKYYSVEMWSGMSNRQCVKTVEHAEEKFFDQFDLLNSQLLHNVSILEQQ